MNYFAEYNTQRSISKAAAQLDLVNACVNHKLPADSKKHVLLKEVLKSAVSSFEKEMLNQSVLDANGFYQRTVQRLNEIKKDRAELMQIRKARRIARELEREIEMREMALIAA